MNKKINKLLKKRIKSLRKEQKELYDKLQTETLLQACYPCGFGKGYVMCTDILNQIVNTNEQILAILSHRINLNDQHISEIFESLLPITGEVAFLFIGHDGGLNIDKKINTEFNKNLFYYNNKLPQSEKITKGTLYKKTTNAVELNEFINTHISKRKIVIVSTYHSCGLLSSINHTIGTVYCDEAHELASTFKETNESKSFMKSYFKILAKRKFFFTATPKDCSDDPTDTNLMNNHKIFGERIGMKHVEVMNEGYVLPCNITILSPTYYNNNFNQSYDSIMNKAYYISESFDYNYDWLRKVSYYPDKIASKLLVKCSNVVEEMWPVFFKLIELRKDIKIFASASKNKDGKQVSTNIIYQNGEELYFNTSENKFVKKGSIPIDRKSYLKALKSLKDNEPAIVLHFDTLSEGINVPGFTCLVIMSETLIGFAKLYQNFGRPIRLNERDKKLLAEGKIKVGDPTGWIKPEAQLIIPYWNSVSDSAQKSMVKKLIHIQTITGSSLNIEIPNGSSIPTGSGIVDTIKPSYTDNRIQNVDELTFVEKLSREILLSQKNNLIKEIQDLSITEQLNYLDSI